DVGVALDTNEQGGGRKRPIKLVKDKNYQQFEELHSQILELRKHNRHIFATFEGWFESHPGNIPSRFLMLRRVSSIFVGEKDNPQFLGEVEETSGAGGPPFPRIFSPSPCRGCPSLRRARFYFLRPEQWVG